MKRSKGRNGEIVDSGSDELADLGSVNGEPHGNKAYEAARKRAEARGEKEVSPDLYEGLAQGFNDLHEPRTRLDSMDNQCVIELHPERLHASFEHIECAHLHVFFALGIINPFGPTFSFTAAIEDWEEGKVLPVVNVMLNPFSQSVEEVARIKIGATWAPLKDLEPLLQLGFGSCRTLVLLIARIPEALRLSFATKVHETFGQEVVDDHELVSSHFGDPWTRVSAMMPGARRW